MRSVYGIRLLPVRAGTPLGWPVAVPRQSVGMALLTEERGLLVALVRGS